VNDAATDSTIDANEILVESVVAQQPPEVVPANGRYEIGKLLGRGGMAAVHQATDLSSGRVVALKAFTLSRDDRHYRDSANLFEREYVTLAQLSHPHIVEVYDYFVADTGPHYTMELVDGGDLREQAPMPWQRACALIDAVCSALALVHSRRLVHRDVSPRNIRCTRDGKAKLIDFGALVPMGPGTTIVGTPQFIAPEVVYHAALDARTDLFSLGATLYYALTGRAPYPVKNFSDLIEAWEHKPPPPSQFVPSIPATLDALVLSLLSVEPASRPRSAFEVMQHLAAIAGLAHDESENVSRAYLSTPTMVGREGLMTAVEREAAKALAGRGRSVLIQGVAGAGRSRVLDATALAAKARGATVLRAHGGARSSEAFEAVSALIAHLATTAPEIALAAANAEKVTELFFGGERRPGEAAAGGPRHVVDDLSKLTVPRVELQDALRRWLLAVAERAPLTVVVDDLHRLDEPSLAFLATLATRANRSRLLLVATAELDVEPTDRMAFEVFRDNSSWFTLDPLGPADVERLLVSVFGDVPNVRFVTTRIHAIARGNPRACMDLAEHLVEKGLVCYEGGAWTLPADLDPSDLPASIEAALEARIGALSPLARFLAQSQALATHHAFTRDDYLRLRPQAPARDVDSAVGDLVSSQLVVSDGRVHTVANESCRVALVASLDAAETTERHRALIDVYAGRRPFGVVRHALAAGLDARGLDELAPSLPETPEKSALVDMANVDANQYAETFLRALAAAERLGRPLREIYELRRWIVTAGVIADHQYFAKAAPEWRARLLLDSGYTDYQSHPEILDRAERLSNAMRIAYERYFATPEAERVYRPDEAVTYLVKLVAISIATAVNRIDLGLAESLPALLEPFAPINPIVDIVWKNAVAMRESTCRLHPERARQLWMEVYERLGDVTENAMEYVDIIRSAVAFGVGVVEAWMGMQSASEWAARLDGDPFQRVSALQLRRTLRIQLGDWDAAEELRKEAEILALQARSRQMFPNVLQVELNAFSLAADMTALKQSIDRAKSLALTAPGWVPTVMTAEARFHVLCGNFQAAVASAEGALALFESEGGPRYPLGQPWAGAIVAQMEALIGLDRPEEARRIGERALEACDKLEIVVPAHDIWRTLALAEARLGEYDRAAARIAGVIEVQRALGISGLRLGASYEARARIAIWADDGAVAEQYMRHTAREYHYGQGSALGARYERLVQEARRIAMGNLPSLADFESGGGMTTPISPTTVVTQAMKGAAQNSECAERALDLLCDERSAAGGFLYLFTQRKLRLVASRGAAQPSTELTEFISRCLQDDLAGMNETTRILTEPQDDATVVERHYTDSLGLKFYPVLMRGLLGAASRYAGLVAFGYRGTPANVNEALLVAISTYFMESRWSDALEYGDWEAQV
jgi:hypothetical protein